MPRIKGLSLQRLVFAGALLLALVALPARADTGPKPSAEFVFEFEFDPPVPIREGQLLLCDDDACTRSRPLEEIGPQEFTCSATRCWSDAYGYGSRLKLLIEFEDRTRTSNVFGKEAFNARYSVLVRATSLEVTEEAATFNRDFGPALGVTLVTELLVAGLITLSLRPRRFHVFLIALASVLSLPVAWFVFPVIGLYDFVTVLLAEVFIVLFEAAFMRFLIARRITVELALAYSVVINLSSFVVGLFVI